MCWCVSMRAVYLVLLNLSFLRICLCLYAYCLLSIFKPSFLRVCVCVCVCVCMCVCVCVVYVTERETV